MEKKKMIVRTLVCVLALVQAQMVFGADPGDFTSALYNGNFSKAESVLKSSAYKWSAKQQESVWSYVISSEYISGNTPMRGAQLLRQYGVSYGANDVSWVIIYNRSEELVRYLVDAGMPLADAVGQSMSSRYSDNLIQYLLDKTTEIQGWYLKTAAKNRKWKFVPQLISKLSADDINLRTTREEHQAEPRNIRYNIAFDPADSKTALMWAAQYGQTNIVRQLVEKGAKVNLRADDGATAASLAYDNGEIEVYNYLKANGAIDFEQRQVAQAPAPQAAPSTTNVYVHPSAPTTPPSTSRPVAPAGWNLSILYGEKNIGGTWSSSVGRGNFMVLNGNGTNGTVNFQVNGVASTGTATISGDNLNIYITSGQFAGQQFRYRIVTNRLIQGDGENFSK